MSGWSSADMAKLHFEICSLLILTETSEELQHYLSLDQDTHLMSVSPCDREVLWVTFHLVVTKGS